MGLCESQKNLKAQEFLTSDFEPLHPTSPNPSPIRNAGRRSVCVCVWGGGGLEEREGRETLSFSRPRPKVQDGFSGRRCQLGRAGRAASPGPREEVLPTSFPSFHEPAATRHPAKMAAATTPRSPPEPGARGRGPRGVSRPQPTTRAILKSRCAAVSFQPDSPFLGVPHDFTYAVVRPGADSLSSVAVAAAAATASLRSVAALSPPALKPASDGLRETRL